MRFSYAMTFGAVTLRLQIPLGFALGYSSYSAMSVWLAYTSWIPNVFAVAIYSMAEAMRPPMVAPMSVDRDRSVVTFWAVRIGFDPFNQEGVRLLPSGNRSFALLASTATASSGMHSRLASSVPIVSGELGALSSSKSKKNNGIQWLYRFKHYLSAR
jgi:hypothetical protein